MKTVLVTRFNWPHPKWQTYSSSTYVNWLRERIDAFSKFTLPSIRNCHLKPDDWFILINPNVPVDIFGILTTLLHGLNFSIICYDGRGLRDSIKDELRKFEYPLEILMTRMDSDDLVSSDFFARLKSLEFSNENLKRPTVISFPGGCNFVPDTNQFFYSAYPDNPFLTLAEKISTPDQASTVFCRMHTELINGEVNIRFLRSFHPMWASVIHDATTENSSLLQTNQVLLSNLEKLRAKFGLST